jgi:hypothetical protein
VRKIPESRQWAWELIALESRAFSRLPNETSRTGQEDAEGASVTFVRKQNLTVGILGSGPIDSCREVLCPELAAPSMKGNWVPVLLE